MIKQIVTIFALVTTMTSCEGIVGGDGYVYDLSTKKPLSGVKVSLFIKDKRHIYYTDTKGFFKGSKFVGCIPTCPCAKIELTKDSFKTMTIDFDDYWKKNNYSPKLRDSMIIYLTRQ